MKIQSLLLSICIWAFAHPIFAQETKPSNICNHPKMVHTVGVQANQLIRQIFNFSNNNPTLNNPYLLTYSMYNMHSKWGIDVGLGYTYNNLFDNDGTTKRETYINELSARIGIQRQIPITRKFSTQLNFHVLCDMTNNKTTTYQDFNFQKTTIKSTSNVLRYGAGPAMAYRYRIHPRVFVGTEMNYYFKIGNNSTKVTTFNEFQGGGNSYTETKSNNDLTTFFLNVPTAIFLQVRL